MPIRESTKYAFANALKTLLQTKDLQKIRVTELCELCELCGATCPTFYYHFRDKYDLTAWIYMKDFEQSVKDNGGVYDQQQLALQLRRMMEQKAFYKKAFSEQTQNALSHYIIEYDQKTVEHLVRKRLQLETLSREMRFSIQFYVRAWVSSLIQWIMDPEDLSADEFVAMVYSNFPQYMKDTYVEELSFDV